MKITYSRRVSIDPVANESSVKGFLDLFVDKDSDWAEWKRVLKDAITALDTIKAGQHRLSLVAAEKPTVIPATVVIPHIQVQTKTKTALVKQLETQLAAVQREKEAIADANLEIDPLLSAEEQLTADTMLKDTQANVVVQEKSLEHELAQAKAELAAIHAKAALEAAPQKPTFIPVPKPTVPRKKTVGK
jgi:hypothetical protein